MHLTPDEWHTAKHALEVAARQFDEDAKTSAEQPRVAEQFQRQAAKSRALAERIEQEA